MTQQPTRAGTVGAILRVTSGNFLEQFDFFLFGFYATYIARTFFPAESEFAALMLTFAVFGSGFLMRPIGAVVLGAYIDRIGRRKGLMVTLAIMGCGTLLIALVPGYQTIGVLMALLGAAICFSGLTKGPASGDKIGKWAWKQIFFIIGANLLFGVLLAGLPSFGIPAMGLIVAIYGLTFVASLAGSQFNFKEVFILATVLAAGCYVAFVWALKLQFPVWPSFIVG